MGDLMINRKGRVPALLAAAALGGLLVAGCSAHASFSIGTAPKVPRQSLENEVATVIAQKVNQAKPKVTCPGDLTGKVGTVMYCSLTPQGSSTSYPVQVKVDSVNGTDVHFNMVVSTTPGHFTAPS
jgi:outer membrane murein-binding lipoprotein Lpp